MVLFHVVCVFIFIVSNLGFVPTEVRRGLKKNKKKVQHPLNPTMKVRSDLHNPSSLLGFWVGDYYTQAPCALYTILYSIYINLDVYVTLRNAPAHAAAYVYGVYGNSIDCA